MMTCKAPVRALAMVRLEAYGNRRPAQLSGGQQQRVALARALVFRPQLVLMDEPLGALDKQLREHMQLEIKHIHENLGVTVVYVTHDQAEALTMSDRIAVFNDGVIQQIDTPARLYERPANSFVARFIGENNILDGTVAELSGDGSCVVRLDGGATVRAVAANVGGVGARTSLSLRPERVRLANGGDDPPGVNRLPAEVRETIYLGDHLRVRLRVDGDDDFTVKIGFHGERAVPQPGETLSVAFSAEDCLALDPVESRAAMVEDV